MKWAEVITVRASVSSAETLASTLQELMNDVTTKSEFEHIRVYNRERIDTDFCIVLFHKGENAQIDGSRTGLRLTTALKEFGLVHHKVWIEMESQITEYPDSVKGAIT